MASKEQNSPSVYQVRIKGQLSPNWQDWFDGMCMAVDDNTDTLLTGEVIDQAALHGLLRQVRDLGLTLISVQQIVPDEDTN